MFECWAKTLQNNRIIVSKYHLKENQDMLTTEKRWKLKEKKSRLKNNIDDIIIY